MTQHMSKERLGAFCPQLVPPWARTECVRSQWMRKLGKNPLTADQSSRGTHKRNECGALRFTKTKQVPEYEPTEMEAYKSGSRSDHTVRVANCKNNLAANIGET